MNGLYQPLYLALCLVSALAGSWTALDLFGRIHANIGRARSAWLVAAALALGLSIWAADFEAMLGLKVGARGHYDPALVALSLTLAIGSAGLAFFIAAQRRGDLALTLLAGVILGAGEGLAHFVGLAAVRTFPIMGFNTAMVVLSFVVAVAASGAGLLAAGRKPSAGTRAAAVGALALAIVGGQYAAIASLKLDLSALPGPADGVDSSGVAYAVALGAVYVLFLASIAALFDRRFEALAAIEAKRNEVQLRAILEQTPVGIIVADAPSGEIRFANSEAEHLMGHPLVGQPIAQGNVPYGPIDDQGRRRSAEARP